MKDCPGGGGPELLLLLKGVLKLNFWIIKWCILFCFIFNVLHSFSYLKLFVQGLHPRLVTEGFEQAKEKAMEVLDSVKVAKDMDRDMLINVAKTSLRTKVHNELADLLTEVGCCLACGSMAT